MKIMTFARWAVLAALAAPLSAQADTDKDKDKTSDEAAIDRAKDKDTDEGAPRAKTKAAAMTKLSDADMQILAHVHAVNQLEVDLGKLAMQRGASKGVRDYGRMLVKDHGQADKDIKAIAKKHKQVIGMDTPATEADRVAAKDSAAAVAKLRKQKGADFDRMFLQMMVTDHEAEVSKLVSKLPTISDPDMKKQLADMQPVLQMHADHARDLEKGTAQASK